MKRVILGLLLFAGLSFGATCGGFTYVVGSPAPSSCTIAGGAVTFNSFAALGFSAGDQIQVSFLDPGALGSLAGVSFGFQPAVSGHGYALGYNASVVGGVFTGINDSATPAGVSTYDFVGTGFGCVMVSNCIKPVMLTNLINSGGFLPLTGMPSQSMTLDFMTRANANAVPEPGTMGMLGIGFVALGLVARRRKRA